MKRLLLGPAIIAIPLALFGCSGSVKTPAELPKVPEVVVRQIPLDDFEHFPPIITTPTPVPTPAPVKKAKPHGPAAPRPARPLPRPRPPAAQAPVETLPPQQGPICIFPLNMIPNCTPGVP
jgi:hypothetical protein